MKDDIFQFMADYAKYYISNPSTAPVYQEVDLNNLKNRLQAGLQESPKEPFQVIHQLIEDLEKGTINSSGSRFFGWVMGGHLKSALAADWLVSLWDQNVALSASAPSLSIIEEITGEWLKTILGLPPQASYSFVTGCQLAHVTCLCSARHHLYCQMGYNIEKSGLYHLPPIKVIVSPKYHGSIRRALRFIGMGLENLIVLPADPAGNINIEAYRYILQANQSFPQMVILQAGDVNTGEFDAFAELIPLAHKYNAWVHIDGAFGLWVNASPAHQHLLAGVDTADSWAIDGHKWLNVPFDSAYAFIRHRESHLAAMSHKESYLIHSSDFRDPIDWTPEWSRRGRALPTYAAILELGNEGIRDLIVRCCDLTKSLVAQLKESSFVKIESYPVINQALVSFVYNKDGQAVNFTDSVLQRLQKRGKVFFGGTDWNNKRCMRISVCNWQTSQKDIDETAIEIIVATNNVFNNNTP